MRSLIHMIGEDKKPVQPSIRFEFNSSQIYTWSGSFVVSSKPPVHDGWF
ncbi:hypothetical protein ACFWJC_15765 [Bacillus wiedmannii]